MAKLILASVLCIFLLVKGTEAQAPGQACGDSDACDAGATCETPKCKADVGESCANNLPCLAAAACDPEDSKCKTKVDEGDTCTPATDNKICDPDAPVTLTCDTKCKVIAGQACTTGTTVCIADAECTGSVTVCTCTGEFTASSDSTQCVANLGPGQSCPVGTNCVTTATCDVVDDVRTCKTTLDAGGDCSITNSTRCNPEALPALTCDGGKCKTTLDAGGDCSKTDSTRCNPDASPALTCNGGKCKTTLEAGGDCSITDNTRCNPEASPALTCDGGKCKTTLEVGGDCSNTDNTRCNPVASPALTCNAGKCKIQAGANCAAATTQCTANAKCDTVCKCNAPDYAAATGGVCVGTKELDEACSNDNCIPTAVCDGGTCKKKESDVNGSCTVASKAACDPTTLACQSDKCKSKIGVDCQGTGDCVAGATCSESKCNCPTGVAPSSDKTQCGGAMGIAASLLLVVATFVTSRFL